MYDMEVALDLADDSIELFESSVDVMEFDGHGDDVAGMLHDIVDDLIFAPFNVHLYKDRTFRRQAVEDVVDRRAVVLIVSPDPLFEMGSLRAEKSLVIDPRQGFSQRAWPQQQHEAQQLTDRVLEGRSNRDR